MRATPINYNISIYDSSPSVLVYSLLLLLVIYTIFAFRFNRFWGLLGFLSVLVFVALPIIRGYFYYGEADGMTQLGWAKSLIQGELSLVTDYLLYPTLPFISTVLSQATGNSLRHSLMLLMVVAVCIFILFSAILIRDLSTSNHIFLATPLLLLPINNIGVHTFPVPSSFAIWLSPLVLYVWLAGQSSRWLLLSTLSFGLLLLSHPRQAVLLLIAISAISGYYYLRGEQRRSAILVPIILLIISYIWISQKAAFVAILPYVANMLITVIETGRFGATTTVSQATSGEAAGAVLLVKYIFKQLLPGIILSVFSVYFVLNNIYDTKSDIGMPLIIGGVCAGIYGIIWSAIGYAWFRFYGSVMIFITIFSAPTLIRLQKRYSVMTRVFLAILLVSSGLVINPSPYEYQYSRQVSESMYSGYSTAFEDIPDDSDIYSTRPVVPHYRDGILGVDRRITSSDKKPWESKIIPNTKSGWEKIKYISVTTSDIEIIRSKGARAPYQSRTLTNLSQERRYSRVIDTGDFTLYWKNGH